MRIKKLLIPFQNVKFNIVLFIVLALSAVLGTLIPQMPEVPERARQWIQSYPTIGPWLEKLGFFNVYHSWWFIALLALMAFDVIVCKLIFGKFPGIKTFPLLQQRAEFAQTLSFRSEWVLAQTSPSDCALDMAQKLEKLGYKTQVQKQQDGYLVLGSKQALQRFGSWVSHIAIVLVLLANLLGALYGFRQTVTIPEGGSVRLSQRPWDLVCDDFRVEWYKNSATPKTFASHLRLFDKGTLAHDQEVLVNEPLVYKTVRFYQATYAPHLKQARLGVFLRDRPKESPTVILRLDEDVPVPKTDYSLRLLQFLPDLVMTKDGPMSQSPMPNNPALRVLISKNGQAQKAVWIFANYPGMHMPPVTENDEFILILADYGHAFATGIQVTYDPGAGLFWIACTILVAALMILFYLHCRKVWIVCRLGENQTVSVLAAAQSSRGQHFEQQWQSLLGHLRAGVFEQRI